MNMKPIVILPPGALSQEDIKKLEENGLCVVVAKDPSTVKFLDPIPSVIGRDAKDQAAIELSRRLLLHDSNCPERRDICKMYVDILLRGEKLDATIPPKSKR